MTEQEIRALWDFQNPAESERRFRDALATDAGDLSSSAEILTQIARALGLQLRFDDAHAILDEVESLAEFEHARVRVRVALERGRLFNSAGEPERAAPQFRSAFDLAERSAEEALAIDAAHMLGIAASPVEQLQWNLRALGMAETSSDDYSRGWVGSLLNNIGWAYHDGGDFESALDHFERAASHHRERRQSREIRIADWSIGRTLRSLNRIDEALAIQRRLATEWELAGEIEPYVHEEMGECLFACGRIEEASSHFARAAAELTNDPWFVKHEPERLGRLQRLGRGEIA